MQNFKIIIYILILFFQIQVLAQYHEVRVDMIEDNIQRNNRLILSFSSLNKENFVFNSTVSSNGSRLIYSLRLQYSLDGRKWIDILDNRGKTINYSTSGKAKTSNFSIELPKICENRDSIWISWRAVKLRGKGKYPNIKIRNIKVNADIDRFLGKSPEINIMFKSQEELQEDLQEEISEIIYNHTPIPYTYPQTRRLIIKGNYIRKNIILSIIGENSRYFKIDNDKIDIDSAGLGIISVSYSPLKIGSHQAKLKITTDKLEQPILINLYGLANKMVDINENLLEKKTDIIDYNTRFSLPVFSEMDYQFKFCFQKKDILNNRINIIYKWFRDNKFLFEMKDNITYNERFQEWKNDTINYCVPISSPSIADSLEIIIEPQNHKLKIKNLYFGFPSLKRSIASGLWSDENIWYPKEVPVMEDFVYISPKHKIRVSDDVVCSMLVLGDSSNISIDAGKMFYISGDITYGRGSWFVVHQDLVPKKWNYVSSPVSNAKALIYSMRKDENETWLMQYNTGKKSKMKDYWSDYIVDPNFPLLPAKGYAVYTNQPLDVIYEGILCDSKVNYPLEYKPKDSWNLVGNPFTAPLSSKKIFEDIDQKIQGNAIFMLDSENGTYNPIIIDGKEEVVLPSMAGFFVESVKENTEISFQRKHQYIPNSASYYWTNHNYLTFNIANKEKNQYILMGMDDNAKFGFDIYDAHKLFGSSEDMPELYFKLEKEELAVNVFPSYPASFNLGYYIGVDTKLSLSVGNLSILPESILLLLEDRDENKFRNLCINSQIDFLTTKGTIENRFRIHIIKALDKYTQNDLLSDIYIWSDNGKLLIYDTEENIYRPQTIILWDKEKKNKIIESNYIKGVLILGNNIPKENYLIDILINDEWIENIPIEVK